jgi:ATP-dependent helicase/nuclease subunit A
MSTAMQARRPVTPPRELVLASAGTGKTYHLSSRLIALLAHGEEPEQILASTFTRKAAGEILDRVLARLAGAALDPAAAGTLARDATLDPASPLPADPIFWQGQLEALVRALHRFNVGTLDAFFVRTAGVFGHELDLPPRWRIAEETTAARLRSEALQEVIAGADRRELVELLRLMNQGAARRSVHDHMLDRMDALLAIQAQLDPAATEPWAAFGAGDGGARPAADEIEALATRFERLPLPSTNAGAPRSNWSKAIVRVATSLRARDWTAFAGETLCQRAIADEPVYDRVEIAAEVCAAVEEGYELARRALRADLAGQIEALGRFTGRYEEVFRELQRREGAYRFEDMTRLLPGRTRSATVPTSTTGWTPAPATSYWTSSRIPRSPQWEALGPLVDEVLSDGDRAGVVVADPKQSIYGWRGGEPQIVHHVGEHYRLAGERLVKSWRSSPVVLDFVNRVFTGISTRPILGKDDVCVETARSWEDDFAPHEAAKPELPGYVRVEVGPRDEGRGSHRPRLMRRAAERVAALSAGGARPLDRRADPPQPDRGAAHPGAAPPGGGRERGGGNPAHRFGRLRGGARPAAARRPPGRLPGTLPRGALAARSGGGGWTIREMAPRPPAPAPACAGSSWRTDTAPPWSGSWMPSSLGRRAGGQAARAAGGARAPPRRAGRRPPCRVRPPGRRHPRRGPALGGGAGDDRAPVEGAGVRHRGPPRAGRAALP